MKELLTLICIIFLIKSQQSIFTFGLVRTFFLSQKVQFGLFCFLPPLLKSNDYKKIKNSSFGFRGSPDDDHGADSQIHFPCRFARLPDFSHLLICFHSSDLIWVINLLQSFNFHSIVVFRSCYIFLALPSKPFFVFWV